MKTIEKFDAMVCKELQQFIVDAVKKEYGVNIRSGGGKYQDTDASLKFEFKLAGEVSPDLKLRQTGTIRSLLSSMTARKFPDLAIEKIDAAIEKIFTDHVEYNGKKYTFEKYNGRAQAPWQFLNKEDNTRFIRFHETTLMDIIYKMAK